MHIANLKYNITILNFFLTNEHKAYPVSIKYVFNDNTFY